MSKLISNTPDIEQPPSIQNTLRKISFNPNPFKATFSNLNAEAERQNELLLKQLYRKINQEERQQIRIKAHQQARTQFAQLKGKLRKNINKQNIEGIMEEKKHHGHSLLSKVMKVPTETVEIDKKYHKRINMKMTLFNEAQHIGNDKTQYRQWYDAQKNCRTNSPIFTRINYLLEKVNSEQKKHKKSAVLLAPLRNSMNCELLRKNPEPYRKIHRKKTEESELMKY